MTGYMGHSARRGRYSRILTAFLAACAALLLISQVGWAMFPPLPSSFYGQVKVNGQNVPEGTVIRALINGKPCGQTTTKMFEGTSMYGLNVNGDETDTKDIDGGVEGDTIQFEIGGVLAKETAVWKGATNIELNLSASSDAMLTGPQMTAQPSPTQTEIIPGFPTQTSVPVETTGTSTASSFPYWVVGLSACVILLGGAGWWLRRGKK